MRTARRTLAVALVVLTSLTAGCTANRPGVSSASAKDAALAFIKAVASDDRDAASALADGPVAQSDMAALRTDLFGSAEPTSVINADLAESPDQSGSPAGGDVTGVYVYAVSTPGSGEPLEVDPPLFLMMDKGGGAWTVDFWDKD